MQTNNNNYISKKYMIYVDNDARMRLMSTGVELVRKDCFNQG